MTVDRTPVFPALLERQPDEAEAPDGLAADVRRWLTAGPSRRAGDDHAALEALCRQIDVRKRLADAPVPKAVAMGAVAVLLADADVDPIDGWSLKCVNSALKALDFDVAAGAPRNATLRAWAFDLLDRHAAATEAGHDGAVSA